MQIFYLVKSCHNQGGGHVIHLIFQTVIDESLRDYMFRVSLLFSNICLNLLKYIVLDIRINTLSVCQPDCI